ncbi:MAG: hypothetical protein V4676_03550 [Bacteroidota bacterium]
MKKILLTTAIITALFSCKKEEAKTENKGGEFTGAHTSVHHGKAWSSTTISKDGKPKKLTLVINDAALNSVPVGETTGDHSHTHDNDVIIPLHAKATTATPFQFIMLNWNPSGHEPAGVYTLPHFDIHFYMTTPAEVATYTDMVKLTTLPPAAYLPANHIAGPPVPKMGLHWIDITSPELSGAPFTQTFIYGSHDAKVVFYEPMITLDFLKNTNSFSRPIPQPAKFAKDGYYPTKMTVTKKDGASQISLEDFVYRQAS